jgi:hypothetical protein
LGNAGCVQLPLAQLSLVHEFPSSVQAPLRLV